MIGTSSERSPVNQSTRFATAFAGMLAVGRYVHVHGFHFVADYPFIDEISRSIGIGFVVWLFSVWWLSRKRRNL